MSHKVIELNPSELDMMQRSINKNFMVQFINSSLVQRANLDVRRSIALYDEDKYFMHALDETLPDVDKVVQLYYAGGVRYWSKGV
ncbi:hypothetical protein BH762_gp032 [Gordonia phage OneUp]|uniref:Uncharacterized protein n=1 Tax=Gordonia phage OneUp TaxID=1838074 RepID=A0A160DEW1_9CAUD|nr:hypothetical protein BH762_gp032 [Gordonia phage OneUp]ANA86486.1 hypothetical protein PBI_ONEUP_153 [Gordonia phage OneUp]